MHFQLTGGSQGSQPFGDRVFGFQLPASGSRLPMPGMPTPEWLMPRWLSPDTRDYPPPSIQSSTLHSTQPSTPTPNLNSLLSHIAAAQFNIARLAASRGVRHADA